VDSSTRGRPNSYHHRELNRALASNCDRPPAQARSRRSGRQAVASLSRPQLAKLVDEAQAASVGPMKINTTAMAYCPHR
jgi:hypothetical protein